MNSANNLEGAIRSLWIPTTTNRKTGNIPTSYIGQTLDHVRTSCMEAGCPLLESKNCYAWYGTPRAAYASMERALEAGKDYSIQHALDNAVRSARYARMGALGDPCALPVDEVPVTAMAAREAGLRGVLAYTHGWRDKGQHLKGLALASCDAPEEADQALDAGWRAAAILRAGSPQKGLCTPAGRKIVVCPAQSRRGVNCNTCGLCDAQAKGPPVVGFIDHGPKTRGSGSW